MALAQREKDKSEKTQNLGVACLLAVAVFPGSCALREQRKGRQRNAHKEETTNTRGDRGGKHCKVSVFEKQRKETSETKKRGDDDLYLKRQRRSASHSVKCS